MGPEEWPGRPEQELRAQRRTIMGGFSRALRVHCGDRLHFFLLPILLCFGFHELDLIIDAHDKAWIMHSQDAVATAKCLNGQTFWQFLMVC